MYIFKNALKSITRNKLRNILIGVIVLVISVSACIALSIRQAAEKTKESTLDSMNVTAQISFDRTKAMEEMAKPDENNDGEAPEEPEGGFDRGKFDFEALTQSLTLEDYMSYTKALDENGSYYYSGSLSLDASGDLLPYGTEEDEEETSTSNSDTQPDMPNGGGMDMNGGAMGGKGMEMQSSGDFALTGYSSYDAMLSMFGTDGSYSVTDGEMFDEESSDLNCVISDELALYNDLSVGDSITLSNPDYEDETYTLKVIGIYTNSASSDEGGGFMMSDPANNIYMSYPALNAIVEASQSADNKTEDSNGDEVSAALDSNISFTYCFSDVESYESFADEVYELGLSEDYTVSSQDLTAFENSLAPLETLSTTAMWFFLIVLAVGGIILVTLNIFNLRERKYEVGVLTAIGMKKSKVALQFLIEIFIVTFTAIIIGAAVGASVSVPVTNALLENQITSASESQSSVNEKFGFDRGQGGENMTPDRQNKSDRLNEFLGGGTQYVDSVSSATDIYVILQLICVGLFLTVISSLAALISIMRYEPLKILSSRT